ncbi:MAG: tRNA (adenosine(37)-N6)-threonylcarbamoyltransferase complex dimerization subunit type 1 TsaB [Clostridiales bacterium]|nr:tRNA (adenosine(37)-N6)-threonylcarbamoyltransferase complex dimerization subunit type 1 TsaB [Clostridiales bacterium]
MNYLAIDTCGRNLTVLLSKDGKDSLYFDPDCGVNHSTQIMCRVEDIISSSNVDLNDIDFFAVVVGAGSFTGIRIGVATIKAMCFAYGKPCLSITSFDTLAYNKPSGNVLAVIDAKHGSCYVSGYTDLENSYPPSFVDKSVVKDLSKTYTLVSFEKISDLDVEVVSVADGLKRAVERQSDMATFNLDEIVPLYIRKSQAEEGR